MTCGFGAWTCARQWGTRLGWEKDFIHVKTQNKVPYFSLKKKGWKIK